MPSEPAESHPKLSRLCVSGRDRLRFIHNFCTNDIKGLVAGRGCEAFFADVKARIVAHGYVLAFEEHLEIWLLGVDCDGLERHLSRYLITEDVRIRRLDDANISAFCVEGDLAAQKTEPCGEHQGATGVALLPTVTAGDDSTPVVLRVQWAGQSVLIRSDTSDATGTMNAGEKIPAEAVPISAATFHSLRIAERFPIIGLDLTSEHLAPEAERNQSAISYHKGCYLGQEPIARLDALGHVNRALRVVEAADSLSGIAGSKIVSTSGRELGIITTDAQSAAGARFGLSVVKLVENESAVTLVRPDGTTCAGVIRPVVTAS